MKKYFIIIFLLFSSTAFGQKATDGVQIDVNNNDDFTGLNILDSAILSAKIIMTGENHTYVNFNSHLEMKMLRYLHKKTGLQNFIIELGEARAHYLNRYVNSADTVAEKYLKATTSPRYMDLFKRIKKFNLELPDSLRIQIWGIDVERFHDLPLLRLAELLPKINIPKNLRSFAEVAVGTAKYIETSGLNEYERSRDLLKSNSDISSISIQKFYINPTVKDLIRFWDSLNPEIRTWLGNSYQETEQVVNWLKQYQQWRKYENTTFQYVWREENIFRNLVKLLDEKPNQKFYGQFGRCHIAYEEQNGDCSWYGYHSVVNKLKTRYFNNSKSVLSIGVFYQGTGDNARGSDYEARELLSKEIAAIAERTKSHSVHLFDLKSKDNELPELSKKFSFVIVNNRFISEPAKDSVESEVVTPKSNSNEDFNPYTAFSVGYGFNNISSSILNNYLSNNGFYSLYANKPWICFGIQMVDTKYSIGADYSWQREQKIYDSDSGDLKFSASTLSLKFIYYPFHIRNIQAGFGLNLGIGGERMEWQPNNINFIAVKPPLKFNNPVNIIGPVFRVQGRIFKYVFLSTEVSKLFDVSKNQWKYEGTTSHYGLENSVTKGLGGMYFGFNLGMIIIQE